MKGNNNQTYEQVEEGDAGAAETDEQGEEADATTAPATPNPATDNSAPLPTYSPVSPASSWVPLSPRLPPPNHVLQALMYAGRGLVEELSTK